MKNRRGIRWYAAVLAACGLMLLTVPVYKLNVQAAEVIATVQGKVMGGDDSEAVVSGYLGWENGD